MKPETLKLKLCKIGNIDEFEFYINVSCVSAKEKNTWCYMDRLSVLVSSIKHVLVPFTWRKNFIITDMILPEYVLTWASI